MPEGKIEISFYQTENSGVHQNPDFMPGFNSKSIKKPLHFLNNQSRISSTKAERIG